MEFTIPLMGAPFPALLPPCEWEMISIPHPSVSSSPRALLPSLCLGLLSLKLNYTSATPYPQPPPSYTQAHMHFTFYSTAFFILCFDSLSLLCFIDLTNFESNEITSVL